MPFSDVIGQDRAVEILKRELSHNRVSQAYLFSGLDAIGKKLTALMLAMAVHCDRVDGDSCGECPVCRKVRNGTHPDVRFYAPMARTKGGTEKIYIDQIRQLLEEISFRPMEGNKKVFIVDEADRMVDQAANAFLKTLEEPPGDSLLILVSAFPDQLPRTVLSRCRSVRFQPLSEGAVERILRQRHGVPEDQARALARYSQGNLDRVLQMNEAELVSERDRFFQWMQEVDPKKVSSVFEVSEHFAKNTKEAIEFTEFLISWTRDLVSMNVRGAAGSLLHADKLSDLTAQCRSRDLTSLLRDLDILEETLARLNMNVNQRLAVEAAFIQMGRVSASDAGVVN